MESIGVIESIYKQRFGIPRQSGLVKSNLSKIVLHSTFSSNAVRGLEEFSHLWVVFAFHATKGRGWKEIVRPPRLGGKEGKGVFATRSPFRPNPIGLSCVKLEGIVVNSSKQVEIKVSGGDFLHGTPVLDIKPYLPYADAVECAQTGWAHNHDRLLNVELADPNMIHELGGFVDRFESEREAIFDTLKYDPRPGHERSRDAEAGQFWSTQIGSFDVDWTVSNWDCLVLRVRPVGSDIS